MKRAALLFAGAAIWLFLFAIPVMADNGPHVKGQDATAKQGSCAGCHRAHSGQAENLLKATMPNLCYSCHGTGNTGASTDVEDGVGYVDTTTAHAGGTATLSGGALPLRGGGFEYALINTGAAGSTTSRNATIGTLTAGQVSTSAHSVDGSPVTMWGNGALGTSGTGETGVQLTCASCHNPHGNGQYRILNPVPDDAYVDSGLFTSVAINDATTKSYTTTNYGLGKNNANGLYGTDDSALNPTTNTSIQFKETVTGVVTAGTFSGTYNEASSRWCAMCHTRYLAGTDSAITDSLDPVFAFRHAQRNLVQPTLAGATATGGIITPATTGATTNFSTTTGNGTYGKYPTGFSLKVSPRDGTSAPIIGSYYDSNGNLIRGVAVVLNVDFADYKLKTTTATTDGDLPSTPNSTGYNPAWPAGSSTVVDAFLFPTMPSGGWPGGVANSGTFVNNQYISAVVSHGSPGGLTTGAPRCITCHVSHGSNATPGTYLGSAASLVTGDGYLGSTLLRLDGRSLCQGCHTK